MIKSTTSVTAVTGSRTMVNKALLFGVALILLFAVNNSFAAPANSNEDQIGFAPSTSSRQAYRNRDTNPPLVEYNIVPVVPQTGIPLDTPMSLGVSSAQQQPSDIGILLNYLVSRHYAGTGNRPRFIPDMDSAKNEYTRKRSSYSRYCAFNAVSCFGRKK